VSVSWKLDGQTLNVTYTAPAGVKAEFVRNDTHNGLSVVVNGKKQPSPCVNWQVGRALRCTPSGDCSSPSRAQARQFPAKGVKIT
jgi:hypothetical protein